MHENPVRPFASRTPALHTWLRLTLAAFVLAVYTSIALATGGVARAEENPSAPSGETGTTTSQPSVGANTATGETPETTPGLKPVAEQALSGTGSISRPEAPGAAEPEKPITGGSLTNATMVTGKIGPAEPKDKPPVDADTQAQTPATVDATTTPETPQPTAPDEIPTAIDATDAIELDAAPITPLPADVSHNSKRSDQPASVATPAIAAPAKAEPRPAVTVAPTLRSVGSPVGFEPTTAVVAAVVPSPDVPAVPVNQRDLGPPLAGLVVDVATVAVSAVHTAATAVAQAFGPDTFLGVPYLLATAVANAAAAVGRTIVGAPLSAPLDGPFPVTYGILDGLAFFNPARPPAGANDPSITVTPEHPLPIILLNGTIATQGVNWSVGAPVLANAGYKVYTFNYGNTSPDPNNPIQSTADIRQSGLELAAEVDRVLAETGAPKVILIGHSQGGGILPVHYINNLGGAAKVSQLIGIAPSNHGTDFNGLIALQSLPILGPLFLDFADSIGPALRQQTVDSPFQQEVYGNGDTRPGVLYTTIISVNDEVVTPTTQQALDGPNVTNIVIQDRYPGQIIGHANIIVSPQALTLVLDALAANPEANPLPNPATVDQNMVAA